MGKNGLFPDFLSLDCLQKILRKWDINDYENKRIIRPEERAALMKGDIATRHADMKSYTCVWTKRILS